MKFIIGIDEAGRGPLAGPVTVGAFMSEGKFGKWIVKNIFDGKLRDSKKLSQRKREEIYKMLLGLKKEGLVSFGVAHISNLVIDKKGISKAVKMGISKTIYTLFHGREILYTNKNLSIRLDGLLKAPEEFKKQKTIIKGDERDVFIACASIVAKVTRDRLMCQLASKYPNYSFDIHKGYGTASHRQAISKLGLSALHRKSYCKHLVIGS